MDSVGRRLKEERQLRGWSQRDLARETGVNADTISGIETDQHEPRPSTLRKLAKGLGVEVRDFFAEPVLPKPEAPGAGPPSIEWASTVSDAGFDSWLKDADPAAILAIHLELDKAVDAADSEAEQVRLRSRRDTSADALVKNYGPLGLVKRWDEPQPGASTEDQEAG